MKFFDTLSEKMGNFAEKINRIVYINVIRDALSLLMPLILAGAVCTLFSNVVCSTTTAGPSIAKLPGMAWLSNFTPIFSAVNYATMNFFALPVATLVGAFLGKERGVNQFVCGIVGLISYVTICDTSAGLTSAYTGTQGLFLAIVVGIVSSEIFCKIMKSGKLEIHMPESVPPNVTLAFNTLFPSMLVFFGFSLCNYLVKLITGGTDIFTLMYKFVQTPLSRVGGSLPGIIVLITVAQLFWTVGIHGNQMISAIRNPLLLELVTANLMALEAGQEMPNIISQPFWYAYMQNGGSGSTLGLIIAVFLFSKREDYKTICRLAILPGIFGINEPITFGLPIVLNPLMAIPFILAPISGAIIGYVMTAIGFAGKMAYTIPWTTPPILNVWLGSGGNLGCVITQIICIVVAVIIYVPFVIMANKEATTD